MKRLRLLGLEGQVPHCCRALLRSAPFPCSDRRTASRQPASRSTRTPARAQDVISMGSIVSGPKKAAQGQRAEGGEGDENPDDLIPLTFKSVHSAIRWNKPVGLLQKYYTRDPAAVSMQDDMNGNFPIHIAAQNGFTDHVMLLLERGADINAINNKGNTALHMAWSYDYTDTAEQLVAKGANVNMANDAGFRAATGIDGDKSRAIVYLMAAKTSEEVLAAMNMAESAPEDTEKGNFVAKCMQLKKRLIKDNLGDVWTADCDARMKDVMSKLT